MFTQCRGCGEIFKVVVDDLVTASAMVRCSSCGAVFNALDTLSAYKPQGGADLILHESDNPPPLLTHEIKQSTVATSTLKHHREDTVSGALNQEEVHLNIKPEFVNDKETVKSPKNALLWVFLTLSMLALLVWQATVALKHGSIELPEGPIKDKICIQTSCYENVGNQKMGKITLVSRSIRQHPGRDNALIITTGIINNNKVSQDFPALQIKMSNLNGEVVAMRRFLPFEYLDSEVLDAGMMPNVLIPVTLELQSPGKNAVTFEVGFSPIVGSK